jgi:hypothetical protein
MKERFEGADTFQEFLRTVQAHEALWHQIFERARLPPEARQAAEEIKGRWHLLVLAEDWCGDAVHILPYLARLEEAFPAFQVRILSRDENPDLMDAHLTSGTRSIPVVIILDREFREVAWWGPRPQPLQDLFLREIKPLPQEERFPKVRAWFAQDRGRTTLREILNRIPVVVGPS